MKAVVNAMVMVRVDREGQEPIYMPTEVQVEGEVQIVGIDKVTQTNFALDENGKMQDFSFVERDMKPFLTEDALKLCFEEFSRKVERSLPYRPEKVAKSS